MKLTPSLDDFLELSKEYNIIPVHCEFYGDTETPVAAYQKLRKDGGPSFMLESVTGGETIGRYTFLGTDPEKEIKIYPDQTVIRHKSGETETINTGDDPLAVVEQLFESYKTPTPDPNEPVFLGGAVGYIGYEYIHTVEPTVPKPDHAELDTPLAYFLITDAVVCFDHAQQRLSIYANANVGESPEKAYTKAKKSIEEILAKLSQPLNREFTPIPATVEKLPEMRSNFTPEEFHGAVSRIKEYIVEGDIFQTVLSQRFEVDFPHSPLSLYRALRNVNPSPYMTLLECDEFAIVSASPEVHVKVKEGQVEIRPIAGTRPRGKTQQEDEQLEKDLLADTKEKAEHLMLVDLARNDIGRVCKVGSIELPQFMIIERYSHVMHIVTQVLGQLDNDKNAFDLMRATFPAGTISGAPKVRAMQIISELEKTQRGSYSGALGYFSFSGNHDSAIAIRTAVLKNEKVYLQAGAGIVADSDPQREYEETVNKAKGMLTAVQQSLADVR
ncbi:MAG: anthranilate synthase component I [Opitutales bacterium]|nr:anthranilate synthase component I [Opitutales bacterium]